MDRDEMKAALIARRERDGQTRGVGFDHGPGTAAPAWMNLPGLVRWSRYTDADGTGWINAVYADGTVLAVMQ